MRLDPAAVPGLRPGAPAPGRGGFGEMPPAPGPVPKPHRNLRRDVGGGTGGSPGSSGWVLSARAVGATLVELNPQPSDLTPQVHLF